MNLYEMDFRNYDPAIARFTSIDPVTHFEYSTYSAFDNNPVFWADPSGADAESDLDKWVAEKKAEWDAIDNGASISDVWGSRRILKSLPKQEKNEKDQDLNSDSNFCDSECRLKNIKRKFDAHSIGFDLIGLDKDSKEYKRLSRKKAALLGMISDSKVQELVAPTDPLGIFLHFGTLGVGSRLGLGLNAITGISQYGWKGLQIGSRQFTVGYRSTTGIGFSYRITNNGVTLAKDFHTLGGRFNYHYHFYQAGKFTKGHLSPSILKQHGYRFKDLLQGLPELKWKKTPVWQALEAARF